MRGHEPLLTMRRRGFVPHSVTLLTTLGYDRWVARWPAETPQWPEIEIAPDETPERLDLRFVVGLPVHVVGHDEVRVERVARCAAAAGAGRVIATVFDGHGPSSGVIRITDTQGALTWPN